VRGVGDQLSNACLDLSSCYLLLTCPPVQTDTAWAYAAYDEMADSPAKHAFHALTKNSFTLNLLLPNAEDSKKTIPWNLDNDLEAPVMLHFPELQDLKREIFSYGALASGMSGSGSSLYAIFDKTDLDLCKKARMLLEQKGHRVFINTMTFDED
ncbi:MAG: hypothetical protein J5803_00870, partial [Desulfovibrio sp.]|nr:hypothetical protein [Desulfovibrio sp.]